MEGAKLMTDFQTVIIQCGGSDSFSQLSGKIERFKEKLWSQKEEAILHLLRIKNKFLD